jgi:trypsin
MGGIRGIVRTLAAACLAVVLAAAPQTGSAHADELGEQGEQGEQGQQGEQIVGGSRVSTDQYPFVVYLAKPNGFQFCGGTIVSDTKVVTAAHCVRDTAAPALRVVAGRDDKLGDGQGVEVAVAHVWVHPRFTDVHSGADIAVLTLAARVRYGPAAIARAGQAELYQPGTPGTILGWGRTAEGGATSRFLMGASVPMVADVDCARAYAAFAPSAMVCAGYREGGVDTCQGDSGGPLVVRGVLVGIASWGDGCARPGKYGVYTRVMTYADEVVAQL